MIDHALIHPKAGYAYLLDHPQQRKFRKGALIFWIAAADIAVDAGEPDLTDILVDRARCVERVGPIFLRIDPAIEPEHPAAFVDRDGLPQRLDAVIGARETQGLYIEQEIVLPRHDDGGDGVPDPDELDFDGASACDPAEMPVFFQP